jgi:hypothetical protein
MQCGKILSSRGGGGFLTDCFTPFFGRCFLVSIPHRRRRRGDEEKEMWRAPSKIKVITCRLHGWSEVKKPYPMGCSCDDERTEGGFSYRISCQSQRFETEAIKLKEKKTARTMEIRALRYRNFMDMES